jgi:hypothetical protein
MQHTEVIRRLAAARTLAGTLAAPARAVPFTAAEQAVLLGVREARDQGAFAIKWHTGEVCRAAGLPARDLERLLGILHQQDRETGAGEAGPGAPRPDPPGPV